MFYIFIHNCSFYVFVLDRFTCADLRFFDMTFESQSSIFQGREFMVLIYCQMPGRVAQSVGHLTRTSGVLGMIPGLATYFRFSFRFFKKGSCQLLAKVCAQSTG